MPLLSARLLIPLAVVVVAWGGLHLLEGNAVTVTPATWPGASTSAAPSEPAAPAMPVAPSPSPSAAAPGGSNIPLLPWALQQLNGSTRDTALGLYGLVQQLERALRDHLKQLARQLEPGR